MVNADLVPAPAVFRRFLRNFHTKNSRVCVAVCEFLASSSDLLKAGRSFTLVKSGRPNGCEDADAVGEVDTDLVGEAVGVLLLVGELDNECDGVAV